MAGKYLVCVAVLGVLSACAAVPETERPSVVVEQWQQLGSFSDGNIRVAVDRASVRGNGVVFRFRDRKVVAYPEKVDFVGVPPYQTAVADWEMDCRRRSYRLLAVQLWGVDGQRVFAHDYSEGSLNLAPVLPGSVSEQQFALVCADAMAEE